MLQIPLKTDTGEIIEGVFLSYLGTPADGKLTLYLEIPHEQGKYYNLLLVCTKNVFKPSIATLTTLETMNKGWAFIVEVQLAEQVKNKRNFLYAKVRAITRLVLRLKKVLDDFPVNATA